MTWTMLARDPETGSFAFAGASGGVGIGERAPYIRANVGVISTQGDANQQYGRDGLVLLAHGASAEEAASMLANSGAGAGSQFHILDARGTAAAFTGQACAQWAGAIKDRGVSLAGNMLAGPEVLSQTLKIYQQTEGAGIPFAERLLHALEAGASAGGDRRGLRSAAILIAGNRPQDSLNLRVNHHSDPLGELRRLYDDRKTHMDQSFLIYGQNGNQMTPEQKRQMLKQHLVSQIMGQQAQNPEQGMAQLAAGIGMGISNMRGQFPDAPGGATPSLGTRLGNFFSFGNNGGLY